jgi:hypothetical protein
MAARLDHADRSCQENTRVGPRKIGNRSLYYGSPASDIQGVFRLLD